MPKAASLPDVATVGDLRLELRRRLSQVFGESGARDADMLLGEVLGASPTELTLRCQEGFDASQESQLNVFVNDRLSGTPIAYVLGHVEFYGLDLLCDRRVLIPRPETEVLVEVALKALPDPRADYSPLVIDVGTGSGNIAIAIAHTRPDARVIATDISAQALEVAILNARRHGLAERIQFIQGNLLEPLVSGLDADLIVSNPPYIADNDPNVEPSVHQFEPHAALYAGPDGIEILTELVSTACRLLRRDGALVCEIGQGQADQVRQLILLSSIWTNLIVHRDLAGTDRALEFQKNNCKR